MLVIATTSSVCESASPAIGPSSWARGVWGCQLSASHLARGAERNGDSVRADRKRMQGAWAVKPGTSTSANSFG
jgi:hypothetical protein